MVTKVSRGAGRPAAAQKSAKAAQRTPLPPKKAAEPTALDKLDTAPAHLEPGAQYGRMTVAELKARAAVLKVKPIPTKKGDLLTAILKAEQAEKKVDQTLRTNAKADAIDAALPVARQKLYPTNAQRARQAGQYAAHTETTREPSANGSKSLPKAEALAAVAADSGWAFEVQGTIEGDRVGLRLSRGGETITCEWVAGVFTLPCVYTIGSRTIQLKNASACRGRMAMPEEKAAEEASRVVARKAAAPAVRKAARPKSLPFSEESLDEQVLDAVYGRKIIWINRISGETEFDTVPRLNDGVHRNRPKIEEGPDGRVLTFPGHGGFRSVLVSSITSVR